ncbi:MAG: peptide ABC transporter substrate-binding protein [Candidatus Limnocylindrales bacterium]
MRTRLTGLLAIAAIVASACSSSTATPTAGPTTAATPTPVATPVVSPTPAGVDITNTTYKPTTPTKTGGSVVIAEWQFPETINVYYAQALTDVEAAQSMFNNLWIVTADLKYIPDLTTGVPTQANGGVALVGAGMDVKFSLKPGMKWSDGQPIMCDDVKGTWEWQMDKAQTGLVGGTTGWEDITGVDGGTGTDCVIHYKALYSGYLGLVAPLLPAHYLKTVPVAKATSDLYPMGNLASGVYSGPYIPTEVKTDAQITLKPNPNNATISGHAPYLDSVIWKYYGDADSMILGFKAGEFDVGQNMQDSDLPKLKDLPADQVLAKPALVYELHAYNNKAIKEKYGDDYVAIIKALKLATDREAIAAGPLGGTVVVSNNFISPLTWYYKDIGGSIKADPAGAKALLEAAGWTVGADGYYAKGGKTLSLEYCTTTRQVRQDTLALVASQLKAVGIKANVNAVPSQPNLFGSWNDEGSNVKCNMVHGNFDVAEFAYSSPLDPIGGYNVYHSSGIPDAAPHNGQNITRTVLPELDAAYDIVKSNVDFDKIRAAMFTVQDIYGNPDKNLYELPLYIRQDVWLHDSKIQNFTGNPTTFAGEWNIVDWWVK